MSNRRYSTMAKYPQHGFTLLELLVAMAIFAILAVAGWQVFDSISRSKERAEIQMDVITELQYGYQQIQRDMMQVVDYKAVSTNSSSSSLSESQQSNESVAQGGATGGLTLTNNRLSFIRHADPDPRYTYSTNLERVVYYYQDDNLVRERYTTLTEDSAEKPLQSIIVKGATGGRIQVLLPEPSIIYPDASASRTGSNRQSSSTQDVNSLDANGSTTQNASLPKGVSIKFMVTLGNDETPIEWLYALPTSSPTTQSPKSEPDSANKNADEKDDNDVDNKGEDNAS